MTQIDPSKVAEVTTLLKKPIVSSACIGCGACVAISGDVFEMSDDTCLSEVRTLDNYE